MFHLNFQISSYPNAKIHHILPDPDIIQVFKIQFLLEASCPTCNPLLRLTVDLGMSAVQRSKYLLVKAVVSDFALELSFWCMHAQ